MMHMGGDINPGKGLEWGLDGYVETNENVGRTHVRSSSEPLNMSSSWDRDTFDHLRINENVGRTHVRSSSEPLNISSGWESLGSSMDRERGYLFTTGDRGVVKLNSVWVRGQLTSAEAGYVNHNGIHVLDVNNLRGVDRRNICVNLLDDLINSIPLHGMLKAVLRRTLRSVLS